ncbi:hypothetical protein L6R46_08115 [Myxococcota bacterium]|nr:hypothetical protein [Myxococcota bacterium]
MRHPSPPTCAQSWLDEAVTVAALGASAGTLWVTDPSGDRAIALALHGRAEAVLTPSATPTDAALLQLKLTTGGLAWEERLQVLGLLTGGRRVFLYHRLREQLPAEARAVWDTQEALIRAGLLQGGLAETRIALARRALGRLCGEAKLSALAQDPSPEGRSTRARALDGPRLRLVLAALPLAGLGAPGLPGRLLHLAAQPAPSPFVEWTLTGRYADPDAARPSLSRRAFDEAAPLRDRLRPSPAPLAESLTRAAPGSLGGIDLGRRGEAEVRALLPSLRRAAAPGALALWWGAPLAGVPPALGVEACRAADRSPFGGDAQLLLLR